MTKKARRKKSSIHNAFLKSSSQIPEVALTSILSKKFKSAGVADFDGAARAAARHILSSRRFETFSWDDDCDTTIEFGQAELDELQEKVGVAIDKFPEIVRNILESTAKDVLQEHESEWQSFRRFEERQLAGFRINLEERWGPALDALRVLHSVSLSEGENFAKRLNASKAKTGLLKRNVTLRLHIRGCQVAAEILTLLENGFADGAMARWRTLHEITTAADVLAASTDETSARYLEHEVVDAKRAMDTYIRVHQQLGYKPPTKREIKEVAEAFSEVVNKYGKSFATPFGWASGVTGKDSPRFSDLEETSGRSAMRSHYKLASYDVHASSRSLTYRIGLLDSSQGPVAGATNAGLQEAGQSTAYTLSQLTWLVLKRGRRLDEALVQRMVLDLRDKIANAFASAATQLEADDADIRKALTAEFGEDAPDFVWG